MNPVNVSFGTPWDVRDRLGESPVWDAERGALYWIDCLGGVIHRADPAGRAIEHRELAPPLGSIGLAADGRLVVARSNDICLFDFDSATLAVVVVLDLDPARFRLNDGKVDREGRFVVGAIDYRRDSLPGAGELFVIDRGRPSVIERGVGLSNSIAFSPDGRTLYFADSPRRQIWRYDYQDGRAFNRRVFVDTEPYGSSPDGATVDADGFLWSSLVRGGAIARFDREGRLDRLIKVPTAHPTCLAFAGRQLDRLFVTSISESENLRAGDALAGRLIEISGLPYRGLPESRYRIA